MRWIDATWILGLGGASRLSQVGLAFAVTPQNTVELAAGADPLTVTVSAPAAYAGSTVFAPSDLGSGPVAVIAPAVGGTPSVGAVVDARTAIWAYDGSEARPTRTWQWRADGVDIPGATQSSFTPAAPQAGAGLSVVETATGVSGARSVASMEITVAA